MQLDLDVIAEFLNTRDERRFGQHEHKDPREREELHSTRALQRWLVARGHGAQSMRVSAADLALTIRLRDGLRTLLDPETPDAQARTAVDAVALQLPLVADFESGQPRLVHAGSTTRRFLAGVLAGCVAAAIEGSWSRMKMCAAPDCRWVFHDDSRNALGRWCAMNVCGNRVKTRNYRTRKRTQTFDRGPTARGRRANQSRSPATDPA